jgi:branched-chain amino acid transport system substrate-binding protein
VALCFLACLERKAPEPAAAAPVVPPTARPATDTEIRLGEVSSLTGSEATFGSSTHQGILLAVKEAGETGGVRGLPVRVITYDDGGKPTEAAAATTKLVVQDRVHVILGEVASSRSLAMAPIAQASRVPMVSSASTNPKVTRGKDFVFRVCFIDPFQGTVMARFARDELGVRRVAILRDVRNDYSVGLADFFARAFAGAGGTVVADRSYGSGDVDFKAQLTAIRRDRPEAIFVPGYYTDVGLVARQARELGIEVPLLGGDGWDSAKLFEIGGEAIEGSYYSNHYSPEDPSPRVRRFVETYRAAYGEEPDAMAALGYDAAKLSLAAIAKARSLRGPDVRDALAAPETFHGVTGDITIDADRLALRPG